MRTLVRFVLATVLSAAGSAGAAVRISEIHYNPPQGPDYEYIEIHNSGSAPVDLGNWALEDGVAFTFPPGTTIAPGEYLVVSRNRSALLSAYPSLSPALVVGEYAGNLANEGERLTLADGSGSPVESFAYDDDAPWEFLADGFGASLERICMEASPALPENWRASALGPPGLEPGFGGSPGAANSVSLCPPSRPPRPRIFVSEILYHPVLEEWYEDIHEFVEIHNAEAEPVSLAGWRIAGGIDYVFPPGATIAPGGYAVVAKNRAMLASIPSYGLRAQDLFGDYLRTLDDGGEKIALVSAEGQGVDSVTYDDDFPWPAAADALGADEAWLDPALLPLEAHRYRGCSLERVSFDHPSNDVSNWAPSPVDGATPGRPNSSARAEPLPIATGILVGPWEKPGEPIRSSDQAWLQVAFSPWGSLSGVEVEWFVDDVSRTDETVSRTPLADDGSGSDLVAGDRVFAGLLPARPANSIVRYRVLADRGSGREVVSPRPSDPYRSHAYFVEPSIATGTRLYHVFISPANWGTMWRNIEAGRVVGCNPNPTWDEKVPAVFVHAGKVYDVRVRYHGSQYNRRNGVRIANWPHPGPNYGTLQALSWRIGFPRYNQLGGKDAVILNKLTQGCPGYTAAVGFKLFALAGIPAPETRFVRFHVNGGYYRYMIEYEHPGEEFVRRYQAERRAKFPALPAEPYVGHLFKSVGLEHEDGPFGWGDERVIGPYCGHPAATRYVYTYERKTNAWEFHDELIGLIEDLDAARRALPNVGPLRSFFLERFDWDLLLDYIAIINWQVPFDDMFQNHYLYQRLSDGKWCVAPWDLDLNFGGWKGADASLYMGEQGDPDNRSGWWNRLKDGFLKAFRSEYEARLLELSNTLLHPDAVAALVDEVSARANPTEASQSASGFSCDFASSAAGFKAFAARRQRLVNERLSSVAVDAGPDRTVFAGQLVRFDARASRPDPGPGVAYEWDNGMTGDYPAYVFAEPGVYVVTLTITVAGVAYRDSVRVTVLPAPERAFLEEDGRVVFEAERWHEEDPHGEPQVWWERVTTPAGYSGEGCARASYSTYRKFSNEYPSSAPELRYAIRFETPGTYRVWVRGHSPSSDADSVYLGLDGVGRDESLAQRFTPGAGFQWSGTTRAGGPQELTVDAAGLHFFSLWVREAGQTIDKIVLARDAGFAPSGLGPPESEEVRIAPRPQFVRGDANRNGAVEISDPVTILLHLFSGGLQLACADHGDADDSGTLEVTDAVRILAYLFRGGPAPAAPFPEPGWDPTPDGEACGEE